jgi:uncharacterized membrane protein YfcA
LAGVGCKNCETKMRPVYWRSFFLMGLSLALGWGMGYVLESIDYGLFVGMIGFFITFLMAYVAFAGPVLRLQEKKEDEMSVSHRPKG